MSLPFQFVLSNKLLLIKVLLPLQTVQLQNVWTEFKNRAFSRGGPGFNKE